MNRGLWLYLLRIVSFEQPRRIVSYFDVLKPERIDIPQAPHQLVRPADDHSRDRDAACEHVLLQHLVAGGVEGVDF